MPPPLVMVPAILLLIGIILFLLIRWWVGKMGAALLFTLSLILNFTLFSPLVLGVVIGREVLDFREKWTTAPKLLLLEKGSDVLLGVSFTEVKDLEQGFSSFKPLGKEQIARLTRLGDARYEALTKDYPMVLVVKREFLEALAGPGKSLAQGPQGAQSPPALPQDPAALQRLLSSARDAFMSGDLGQVARVAADMQKAFGEQGMDDGVALARQIEQAARAGDTKALETLGPKLAQLAPAGGGPFPGGGGTLPIPVSGDLLLKAIDADNPVEVLAQYVPAQAIQEMSGGEPARLKLMLMFFLLQNHLQTGFDPLILLSEYRKGHIQLYPESTISTIVKLLPIEGLGELMNFKPKP